MKWTYWPADIPPGWAETWQLDDDDVIQPDRGFVYRLCLVHYSGTDKWTVYAERKSTKAQGKIIGQLPYGTPEEELKAMAIVMWRMG